MLGAVITTLSAAATRAWSSGPWLWGRSLDLLIFGGTAALALALVGLGHVTGWSHADLPDWGFIAFVLGVDVAHVYSTLFRTYFDRSEITLRRARYFVLPAALYAAGVGLYALGSLVFWRVLAYVAVFHFVRQQAGWVAIYRARARQGKSDRLIDDAAVYASTLYPLLHWHAQGSDAQFAWFIRGDFVTARALVSVLPFARAAFILALTVFVVRQVQLAWSTRTVHVGKVLVVSSTAACWYIGIVGTNSDYDFTVTNVIIHGVPYSALLWAYARERQKHAPESLGGQIAAGGALAFVGSLLVLAFVEEMAWDRLVWHERQWLFGGTLSLGDAALAFVVPLLALPQAMHYVLDGFLWRRGETRRLPAQRAALGFSP
jgi:hypothetical protein